jgi:toxin ParE1/3/4
MAYHVELMPRADRDLRDIYWRIHADDSPQAFAWFNGLEAMIYSLDKHPSRGAVTPESSKLRHLLYGAKPHVYRIIYAIDERNRKVSVLHIRHGARDSFAPQEM